MLAGQKTGPGPGPGSPKTGPIFGSYFSGISGFGTVRSGFYSMLIPTSHTLKLDNLKKQRQHETLNGQIGQN